MKRVQLLFPLLFLVTFTANGICKSQQYKIASVLFEGNTVFSTHRLHGVMLSRPSGFLHSSWYYPEILKDDLQSIELLYHNNGYLEAKVTHHNVSIDSTRREVKIEIYVSEGELTYVEGVTVFGNQALNDQLLQEDISLKAGEPFKRKKLEDTNLALLTRYASAGYLECEIQPDVRINETSHLALINFIIREHYQSRIQSIRINGLEKTKPHIVLRELRFQEGEVVNYRKLLESQRNLYLTGLFQSVFVRPVLIQESDSTQKEILIEVKENKSGEFNITLGYQSIEKLRGKIELYTTNLRGTARKMGIASRASFVNRGLEASFSEPWSFGVPWRTDLNALLDYQEEPGFTINRTSGKITFGRTFLRQSSIQFAFKREYVKLSDVKVTPLPDDLKTNLYSFRSALIFDTRNNLFNPTNGLFVELSNEIAGAFLSSTHTFDRVIIRQKYFYPISRETVLATSFQVGWMDSPRGLTSIPLHERFYTGGPQSLRGFDYQKVGPLDVKGVPIGGRLQVVWNVLEIRRSLYKMIGAALFIDAGNVWSNPEDFSFHALRMAYGGGLRINTPIGLARIDIGLNADRKQNESWGKIYVSMGHAF